MCDCTHTPSSALVGLTSHPAVVHVLPSVSVHGVLVCGVHSPLVASQPFLHSSAPGQTLLLWLWSHVPWPLQPAVVHALPSVSAHGVLFEANMCVCTHTPSSGLVALISQPAVVHVLPSLSVHGVLVFGVHFPLVVSHTPLHSSAAGQTLELWFWSHTPWPLQPAVVHALPSLSAHGVLFEANMCVCTHTPSSGLVALISQPAVVHVLPSVSVHGVLACGVHSPLVVSQPLLHSSAPGQTLLLWFWSHTPCPLQPAVVHALPSLSAHGVLFEANMCVCTHTPSSALVGLISQPAVVHVLPSVSVHGVLVFGVHCPLVVSQTPLH